VCAEGVLRADGGWNTIKSFQGPGDVEGRVVPEDGALSGGMVEVGGFVKDFGGFREDEEAVREPFGDPEELKVVFGGLSFEMKPGPSTEIRGVTAEIDGDIPDMTGNGTDELSLGLAELIM
jgi:hypothetical protein